MHVCEVCDLRRSRHNGTAAAPRHTAAFGLRIRGASASRDTVEGGSQQAALRLHLHAEWKPATKPDEAFVAPTRRRRRLLDTRATSMMDLDDSRQLPQL